MQKHQVERVIERCARHSLRSGKYSTARLPERSCLPQQGSQAGVKRPYLPMNSARRSVRPGRETTSRRARRTGAGSRSSTCRRVIERCTRHSLQLRENTRHRRERSCLHQRGPDAGASAGRRRYGGSAPWEKQRPLPCAAAPAPPHSQSRSAPRLLTPL